MRITHCKSGQQAKSYYQASDYYESGPDQLKGWWFGKSAATLGLEGEVDKLAFERLIDNQHPQTGEKLTQRNHLNRRCGTDITVSVPKSISTHWALTGDDRILDAVREAANDTFQELEHDVKTRVNVSRGHMKLEKTGNIVGAAWLHTTARPMDGYSDPQLHVHGFVANCTQLQSKRWTAVDLSSVVRDSGYYEAIFQSSLADKIEALGYATERNRQNFELAGYDRATLQKFSRRSGLIEQLAADWGITNADEKDKLGQRTRETKQQAYIPEEDLPEHWRSLLTDREKEKVQAVQDGHVQSKLARVSAAQAVDYAIEHHFATESVVRERKLLGTAIKHGIGSVSHEEIARELSGRDLVRQGHGEDCLATTKEILAEEKQILAFARKGRGSLRPLANDHLISRDWLSEEQQLAIIGLLSSTDQLQILRGVAGSGKTTMMQETIEAIEASGKPVAILAPTAEAAYDVLKEKEGFPAETVDAFLTNEKAQHQYARGVIWVDEAGLVGSENMARLVQVAGDLHARIILSGDARQHKSVARGKPLELLEKEAGIMPKEVKEIRRQSGEYKKAVTLLSDGEAAKAIQKLDELGYIHEIDDATERYHKLATDYADSLDQKKKTLIVAPTHAERAAVTDAVREELRARGVIKGEDRQVSVLQSKRLSPAEKQDPINYEPGDVIEFVTKGRGGYQPGDRLTVSEVNKGNIIAEIHGRPVEVPVQSPKSFDVFRKAEKQLAIGDTIRITKNRRPDKKSNEKRLNNGSLFQVTGFEKNGNIKLSNGQTIEPAWGHFEHGFTVTSYGSQGKTFDRVLVAQSSLSFPASSPEQAYVSVSRGREQVHLYTDDKEELKDAIAKPKHTMLASQLKQNAPVPGNPSTRDHLARMAATIRSRAQAYARWQKQQLTQLKNWAAGKELQQAK